MSGSSASAIARTAASSSPRAAESVVASRAVVPWLAWNRAARTHSCGSPLMKCAPPPPWTWRSTKPGARTWPARSSVRSAAGGGPSATASTRPPVTATHVPAGSSAGVNTRAPLSRRSALIASA